MRKRSGERVICVVPGNNLGGIADGIDGDDVVDVVALNLPGNAGEGNQVVGHGDDMIGVDRIRQRKTQRAAGGLAMRAVTVAEGVRRRRSDHGDVDVHFAVLNCLPAPAVRAQNAHAAHFPLRAVVAQRSIHAAFDVVDHARGHQFDGGLLRRKRCAGKPREIFDANSCRRFERHQGDAVAIPQVMVRGNDHAIAQAAFSERGLEVGHALIAILGIIGGGPDRRRSFVPVRLVLADARVGNLGTTVHHLRDHAPGGVDH